MKHTTAFVAVSLATWAFSPLSRAARATGRPDASSAPRLDVVFCVDTTGSMSDEIGVVKRKMREMVANIAVGDPTPDVRFGLVIYRDRGDEYVTKRYDLTSDIDAVVEYINGIQATGGNDYPESMNEALHVAVQEMNWDPGAGVGRSIFLIADAPPHLDYENDYDYRDEATEALGKGIVIDTIGCSGLEEKDQSLFEEIANIASGSFELLTYMREYVKADGEKGVVMSAGGELYALTTPAASDEWREGATVLARRGQAEKLAEGDAAEGVVTGGLVVGRDLRAKTSRGYTAEGELDDRFFGAYAARASGPAGAAGAKGDAGPPAAGEPPGAHFGAGHDRVIVGRPLDVTAGGSVALAEGANNLDVLLTRRVQYQLAQQGVRFADQPYLPHAEWQGGSCAQEQRRAMVARNQAEWQAVWKLIAEAEGRDEPPGVDFARDMVLAAFGGVNWKGRTLRIEDVWEDGTGLHALVKRGPDDPEATAPYHVIVVARYEGKVIWK
jgi:Mg-chelatase subunit ChlD